MKAGDKVPVIIAGQVVAQATIRETGDGTATLVVPATLVVMATRTELAVETPPADTTGTETLITGVERTSADTPPVESAAVGGNVGGDNDQTTDTSTSADATQEASTSETTTTEDVSTQTPPVQDVSPTVEASGEVSE